MSELTPARWFPYRRPNERAWARLFALPPASGSASLFNRWPALLPAGIEFCAVQLPGREQRFVEPAFDRMADMVAAVVDAISPLLDKPYAFFGHSMGGWVWYEVIRHLVKAGTQLPVHFYASAIRAPQLPDLERLHTLGDAAVIECLRKDGLIPEELLTSSDFMEAIFPMLRADASVTETYSHVSGPPLDVPITVFWGTRDTKITHEEVSAWQPHTTKDFREVRVDGDHGFLKVAAEQLVDAVVDPLRALLR